MGISVAALANTPRRDRGATRALYSYPAKFQAHLPSALIRLWSAPGDLVVDPFVGGGTTLLEAMLLGRRSLGVDLNPLACLVARVKTTPLPAADVRAAGELAARLRSSPRSLLDAEDVACLGGPLAGEIEALAAAISTEDGPIADVLRLALLQSFRTAGRRDFAAPSLVPLFLRRVAEAAAAVGALPACAPRPAIACGPAEALALADGAARLVVTSPPYKDVDVEYAHLQIQRPALGRSRRSLFAWRLLGADPLPKRALQGGTGERYFTALDRALSEIRRVLAPGGRAFFWLGWKDDGERTRFRRALAAAGLEPGEEIRARLGRDRGASTRSHHGRDEFSGVAVDYLVAATRGG